MPQLTPVARNITATLTALFCVAGLIYFFTARRKASTPPEFVRHAGPQNITRTPLRLKEIRPLPSSRPVTVKPTEDKLMTVCGAEWRNLADQGLEEAKTELLSARPFFSPNCLKAMHDGITLGGIKTFVRECQMELTRVENIEKECLPFLVSLKAYVNRAVDQGDRPVSEMDPSDLAFQLMGGMLSLKTASQEEIGRNIDLADAILERNPDAYDAYKAKLMSYLMRELRFGQEVDEELYQELYNELWTFRGGEADTPLSDLQLEASPEDRFANRASELDGADADLVKLPFLRLKAKGNFEELQLLAEEYRDAYPESFVGYRYLAEALWAQGDRDGAVSTIKNTLGQEVTDGEAYELLESLTNQDALEVLTQPRLR